MGAPSEVGSKEPVDHAHEGDCYGLGEDGFKPFLDTVGHSKVDDAGQSDVDVMP